MGLVTCWVVNLVGFGGTPPNAARQNSAPKSEVVFLNGLAIGLILGVFLEGQPISEVTGQTDLKDALRSFFPFK